MQGKLFYNIKDLYDRTTGLMGKQGDHMFVPTLQSDYALVIIDHYETQVNVNDYEPVLLESITLPLDNSGITMEMDTLGFQTAKFKGGNVWNFTFLGTPYEKDNKTYSSIIHYYYGQRFSENGLLKLKRNSGSMTSRESLNGMYISSLPACLIINMRTNNIVYIMKDCTFSYPTYTASPSNNSIAFYKTNVAYSYYKEYIYDNYDATKNSLASSQTTRVENSDGTSDIFRDLSKF